VTKRHPKRPQDTVRGSADVGTSMFTRIARPIFPKCYVHAIFRADYGALKSGSNSVNQLNAENDE